MSASPATIQVKPSGHRRSVAGARRHQCHSQQSDRSGRFHAQSAGWSERHATGGAGRLHHLISNIVNYTFGTQVQAGVAQPSLNTNGLGASGNLTAPFNAGGALSDYATNLVSSQAEQSATTTSNLTTEQALQSSLNTKVTAVSGVNMDTEMSLMLNLQNAYGANARVISAVQAMFTDIMQAVQ